LNDSPAGALHGCPLAEPPSAPASAVSTGEIRPPSNPGNPAKVRPISAPQILIDGDVV